MLHADRFCDATAAAIDYPEVRAIIDRAGPIGGIDQVSDSVGFLGDAGSRALLRALYA